MSNILDTVAVNGDIIFINSLKYTQIQKNNGHKHVLQSKENIFKPKCRKALKRKLKKYKLRTDGKEDQDIIDVSRTLLFSLKIKSPNKLINHNHPTNKINSENITPRNYLFKKVTKRENNNLEVNNCEITEIIKKTMETKTNAFKLMMDSRNKSIGTNSVGKEKDINEFEMQDVIEKKELKAKRNLMLQKMAETKGSLKKKELEEYKEECIKRKMEKRAERLKNMICKEPSKEPKTSKKLKISPFEHSKQMPSPIAPSIIKELNNDVRLLDNKTISNTLPEDDEFLKKLSPSLKKENMLCYFKKIQHGSDNYVFQESSDDDNQIIKVKLTPKTKKITKKKKLSLKRIERIETNDCNEKQKFNPGTQNDTRIIDGSCTNNKFNKQEQRNIDNKDIQNFQYQRDGNEFKEAVIVEGKPKRNVKRPIRYNDDINLTSSDEEYHIITPRKKKYIESKAKKNNNGSKIIHMKSSIEIMQEPSKNEKEGTKEVDQPKKTIKLAPIFAMKTQLKPEYSEAKQKLLQSGVPDQLKRNIAQHNIRDAVPVNFPTVVHVQQIKNTNEVASFSYLHVINFDENIEEIKNKDITLKKIISLGNIENNYRFVLPKINIKNMLQSMKQMHPNFPIYRTYCSLKNKYKGEFNCNYPNLNNSIDIINDMIDVKNLNPDTLNWTDKYRALSTNQILGNFESIKELKRWLFSWTESEVRSKKDLNGNSDSSDFFHSDMDSGDSVKTTNNLLIITGPVGSGKTSSVYAIAAELAMKVIEVNPSTKRNGKVMLQDLHEATQSHNVNRGKGSSSTEYSQKSQEIIEIDIQKNTKKRGRPKKKKENVKVQLSNFGNVTSETLSQESVRTHMSLILIDDADIIFEQDDGFCSAIAQLVHCSKRPIILITSSLSCLHLQRFLQCGRIIKFKPLLPSILGTWLDIMCLADSGVCWPGLGAKFLDFFNGDIRKTINCLQFYMSTNTFNALKEEDSCSLNNDYKPFLDDESSSMSWANSNMLETKDNTPEATNDLENSVWMEFTIHQLPFLNFTYPFKLFDIWWSLPTFLYHNNSIEFISEKEQINGIKNRQKTTVELAEIANVIDRISISDCLSNRRLYAKTNITSHPWFASESDNITENENFYEYNKCHEIGNEMLHYLVTRSITDTQHSSENNSNIKLSSPDMTLQRKRDRIISRHNDLTSYLNLASVLDRRALALDYWPACRDICRTERAKTDSKSKRHNRFYHYLKSLNVMSKTELFDNLCDSLYPTNAMT